MSKLKQLLQQMIFLANQGCQTCGHVNKDPKKMFCENCGRQ